MTLKTLIIFNSKSGILYPKHYRQTFLKQYSHYAPNEECFWLELTPKPLDEDLKTYYWPDFKKIIIIGGDGTIKSVATYLIKNNLEIPLALIPQGSANILAASLNIPFITKLAIKKAAGGLPKKIDVARLNSQEYFLVGLSLGLISQIVAGTKSKLKNYLGWLAYVASVFKNLTIKDSEFTITIDGQHYTITGNSLIVANAFSLYQLKTINPPNRRSREKNAIDPADGLLDIIVTQNKTIFGFLTFIFFLLGNLKPNKITFYKTGREIIIEQPSGQPKTIMMDGEIIVGTDKIAIKILPSRLSILI